MTAAANAGYDNHPNIQRIVRRRLQGVDLRRNRSSGCRYFESTEHFTDVSSIETRTLREV